MPKLIEIKGGERYGRLTLTGRDMFKREGKRNDRARYVECVCDCGNVVRINRGMLRYRTKSCGCLLKEKAKERGKTRFSKHGMGTTRIYHIYQAIKQRCGNPNHFGYKYYGGRGIKNLWESFEDFYRDMGESYEKHVREFGEIGTTIDRIDGNGHYCKENCRRATRREQIINRDLHNPIYLSRKKMRGEDTTDTTSEQVEKPRGERQSWSEL